MGCQQLSGRKTDNSKHGESAQIGGGDSIVATRTRIIIAMPVLDVFAATLPDPKCCHNDAIDKDPAIIRTAPQALDRVSFHAEMTGSC